jgi:hypothetical protein
VHRRDFLLLRQPAAPRVIEISCERLHMSYLELQAATNQDTRADEELSFEEPPSVLPRREIDEWLGDLEAQLSGAEIIKVVGEEWLQPEALRVRVDALLASLSRRGVLIQRC